MDILHWKKTADAVFIDLRKAFDKINDQLIIKNCIENKTSIGATSTFLKKELKAKNCS